MTAQLRRRKRWWVSSVSLRMKKRGYVIIYSPLPAGIGQLGWFFKPKSAAQAPGSGFGRRQDGVQRCLLRDVSQVDQHRDGIR
jgi:hypothetical protein